MSQNLKICQNYCIENFTFCNNKFPLETLGIETLKYSGNCKDPYCSNNYILSGPPVHEFCTSSVG